MQGAFGEGGCSYSSGTDGTETALHQMWGGIDAVGCEGEMEREKRLVWGSSFGQNVEEFDGSDSWLVRLLRIS